MTALIPAVYFDGRTSRATRVTVWLEDRTLRWHTEDRTQEWQAALDAIEPSARVSGLPFTLSLPGGAHLQIDHDRLPAHWFPRHHRIERVVDWLERRWPAALVSVVVVVVALLGLFEIGVPWAADRIAMHMPPSVERALGGQSLAAMEGGLLQPTTLSVERQAHLRRLFEHFAEGVPDLARASLRFYHSPLIGANAFALPGGTVVFTDELAKALPDDESFVAVVAHELGHQAHHHMLRQVLRSSGVFIVAGMLMGDVTSLGGVTAAVPMFLINAHYSRSFEQDADSFAFNALAQQGIDPVAFVHAMQALKRAHPEMQGMDKSLRYVSSHPLDEARMARANEASRAFQAHRAATDPAAPSH